MRRCCSDGRRVAGAVNARTVVDAHPAGLDRVVRPRRNDLSGETSSPRLVRHGPPGRDGRAAHGRCCGAGGREPFGITAGITPSNSGCAVVALRTKNPAVAGLSMRPRGLEPPRPIQATRPSTLSCVDRSVRSGDLQRFSAEPLSTWTHLAGRLLSRLLSRPAIRPAIRPAMATRAVSAPNVVGRSAPAVLSDDYVGKPQK